MLKNKNQETLLQANNVSTLSHETANSPLKQIINLLSPADLQNTDIAFCLYEKFIEEDEFYKTSINASNTRVKKIISSFVGDEEKQTLIKLEKQLKLLFIENRKADLKIMKLFKSGKRNAFTIQSN